MLFPYLIPNRGPPASTTRLVLHSSHEEDSRCRSPCARLCQPCLCRRTSSPPPSPSSSPLRIEVVANVALTGHGSAVPLQLWRSANPSRLLPADSLGRISFGPVTLGTIAPPRIVLHSGHEEDCGSIAFAGVRLPGICVEVPSPTPAENSPRPSACGPPAKSSSNASCASQAASGRATSRIVNP